jgi:hypothetical protein
VHSVSGLGRDVDNEGEVWYLAHTICWPATRDVDGALARCLVPQKTMNNVSGMQCNGSGSCGGKALVFDRHK